MATQSLNTGISDGGHMGLYPRCGICADTIFRHERVIALFGNRDSTSYHGHTRPFAFPQPGQTNERLDGRLFCRYPDCKQCAASPEFAPVHFDCFEIFRQCTVTTSGALDRLWISAAWRHPWRGAQPIHLSGPLVDRDILRRIAGFCGFRRLDILPTELLEIVRQYSRHSFLWRCISVLQLADYISTTKPQPLVLVPLREILSWDRGGKFEHVGSRIRPLTLKLTIDYAGIKEIKRFSKPPAYVGKYTSYLAFIVQSERSISHVMVQLKHGLLRLDLPVGSQPLPIWNTPGPPSLPSRTELTSCRIFHTAEMNKISGVTFFFSLGQLFGIHVHSAEESCALDTFERMPNRLRRTIVWIYLPRSQHDRVLALGMRKAKHGLNILTVMNILVRTELVGDVVVGLPFTGAVVDQCLAASTPSTMMTMIYGEPREGRPVPFLGGHPEPSNETLPRPFPLEKPGAGPVDGAYFSWASLRDVSSTVVFYDQNTGYCRGIVFRYANGGSRAVGQCRLHVDPAESVARPVRLYFRMERMIHNVQVKFKQAASTDYVENMAGWESRPMEGIVKFWFTPESSFLVVFRPGMQTRVCGAVTDGAD